MTEGYAVTVHRIRMGGGSPALETYAAWKSSEAEAVEAIKKAANVTDEKVEVSGPLTQRTLEIFGLKKDQRCKIQVYS